MHLMGFYTKTPYSHAATGLKETFAEARVPYAKIMGCAQFGTLRAASRGVSSSGGDGRIKPAPKPHHPERQTKLRPSIKVTQDDLIVG